MISTSIQSLCSVKSYAVTDCRSYLLMGLARLSSPLDLEIHLSPCLGAGSFVLFLGTFLALRVWVSRHRNEARARGMQDSFKCLNRPSQMQRMRSAVSGP